jgi:neutral amino acid transport system ATP-binding protein
VAEEPGSPKPDPILVAHSVARRFGGLITVNVDHSELQADRSPRSLGLTALARPPFFDVLAGFHHGHTGRWSFNGKDITAFAGTA